MPVQVEDQVREAVHHPRMLGEAVDGVHVAVHLQPTGHHVEVAQLTLDRPENVEGSQLGGRDRRIERHLASHLPERAPPTVAERRPVAGDVRHVVPAYEAPVGQRDARWRNLWRRDDEATLGQPLGDAGHGRKATSQPDPPCRSRRSIRPRASPGSVSVDP